MKRSPIARRTPLKASRELQRRTPLQPKTELRATAPLERSSVPLKRAPLVQKRVKPKLTAAQKRPLILRSGGFCELRYPRVCTGRATDVAHRIAEGMGGRHGVAAEANDRLSAVLHSCRQCHDWCHQNPISARGFGWILRNGDVPLRERVYYAGRGWCHLDDEGAVHRA